MCKDSDYIRYAVGDRFDKNLGGDGAIFEIHDGMFNIVIGMSDFTDEEISALESGALDVYLTVIEGIVFVTAKFGDSFIFDMPFNAGLYKDFDTDISEKTGLVGVIFVIDNNDNIIKAMRGYGFDPVFTEYLYKFAKQQRKMGIDNYDEHLKKVYERYTAADIINFAIGKNRARRII